MKVNNASLTGESEDLPRKVERGTESTNPFEAKNLAFFGTQCTEGTGVGVVFKTGDETVIGQIANLAQTAKAEQTPLNKEIHRFIKIISTVAISEGIIFFVLGVA